MREGFVITNTNVKTTSVSVCKVWKGGALGQVTVRLFADGKEADRAVLTSRTKWKHTFEGLPKYDAKDGHEIRYTVGEDVPAGYTAHVSGSAAKGFVITNYRTDICDPKPPKPEEPPRQEPKPSAPNTGDENDPAIWLMLTAASAVSALLISAVSRRPKKKR